MSIKSFVSLVSFVSFVSLGSIGLWLGKLDAVNLQVRKLHSPQFAKPD